MVLAYCLYGLDIHEGAWYIQRTRVARALRRMDVVMGIQIRVLPLWILMSPGRLPKGMPSFMVSPSPMSMMPPAISIDSGFMGYINPWALIKIFNGSGKVASYLNAGVRVLGMDRLKEAHIAYLSMEVGIRKDMPTYSGGLGVLAGDTLRSCADLGVPVVGVSLVYWKGFFTQSIDYDGNQHERDKEWEPSQFMEHLEPEVYVPIEGRQVKVTAWRYELVGLTGVRNSIIFLDTNHDENDDFGRSLTDHLYGGDSRYRLAQEVVLGIGGVRILEAIGCNIQKYHMNEGHSALLTLEIFQRFCGQEDCMQKVRDHCVFTTHTPVPAGHDSFERGLVEQLLTGYLTDEMRELAYEDNSMSMTHLALRFSEYVNGVAKKHSEVSREMFPGYHIDSVTNGVHSAFWTSDPFQRLFDVYIPGWRNDPFSLRYVLSIPKDEIWSAHMQAKQKLIDYVRDRYGIEMDTRVFTIGFARRAATYKRGSLLFRDLERLRSIARERGGLQIIYGGKAHPHDFEGKQVIKEIVTKMHELSPDIKVCYLEDYDMDVAQTLIPGVDIWLNTPKRPREASGTSGMKAAHNGVPHLSTLDGWWLEGHIEEVTGFSIGEHPKRSPEPSEEDEVEDLYSKLDYLILPRYYNEPDQWLTMMRHSIAMNGSFFNTHRMVQQYVLNAYFK